MSSERSDYIQPVTDHREGCVAPFIGEDCECPVTGVLLTLSQLRVLYEAANSYDTRLPAETHRPIWVHPIERLLDKERSS